MQIFYSIVFFLLTLLLASAGYSSNKHINASVICGAALIGFLWAMTTGIVPVLCMFTITFLVMIAGLSDINSFAISFILSMPAIIRLTQWTIAAINS